MQLAPITPITQPPVPAMGQLSEKPRLGLASKNAAWNPGPNVCNSTVLLGFEASLHLNRIRPRYRGEQYDPDLNLYYLRARYYNPATGRFLSRDPIDHSLRAPDELHKYLYGNGDPVNIADPNGQGLFDYEETEKISWQETVTYARRIGSLARCVLSAEVLVLRAVDGRLSFHDPFTDIALISLAWSCSSSIFQNLPI